MEDSTEKTSMLHSQINGDDDGKHRYSSPDLSSTAAVDPLTSQGGVARDEEEDIDGIEPNNNTVEVSTKQKMDTRIVKTSKEGNTNGKEIMKDSEDSHGFNDGNEKSDEETDEHDESVENQGPVSMLGRRPVIRPDRGRGSGGQTN